jgi:hypothetical protein
MNFGDSLSSADVMGSREVALVVTYLNMNACTKVQALRHLKSWSPAEPKKVGDHYEIHRDDAWKAIQEHFPGALARIGCTSIESLILDADAYFLRHFEEEDLY